MRRAAWRLAAALAAGAAAAPALPQPLADRMHAEGVEWFRAARFPAAFGRFVRLADLGHEPSARYALWMCLNGPELFGRDWDCHGEQLQDWSRLAGVPTPPLRPRLYGRTIVAADRTAPTPPRGRLAPPPR
ncbi:hypothetical protein ACPOLB_26930 [Rubrivivax sp. RP6-9]|uniref:hypothetical protein n=1 Tax=Rubrivivax sp. RP6-9 TaxID=3415750 RepID=UPI003CC55232